MLILAFVNFSLFLSLICLEAMLENVEDTETSVRKVGLCITITIFFNNS